MRPFVLGLTGSIGMGKSTAAAMFRDEGCPVWDADAAVHRLYGPGGAAVERVAALVPGAVVEGAVDRSRLRAALERDPSLFSRLEAAVHPLVAADRERFLRAAGDEGVVVLDVPLLFEKGSDRDCDGVAVVSACADTQWARLMARGLDAEGARLLLSRQMPDADKRARADWVIPSETMDGARAAVRGVLEEIRAGRAGRARERRQGREGG